MTTTETTTSSLTKLRCLEGVHVDRLGRELRYECEVVGGVAGGVGLWNKSKSIRSSPSTQKR